MQVRLFQMKTNNYENTDEDMPQKDIKKNSSDKKESSSRINYKIIALIAVLAIVDLVYNLYFFYDPYFDIKDVFYMVGIAGCGIASIVVARKYYGSKMLIKAYIFLGLAFFSWFVADVGYYYYQFVLEIDPWPSIFDIGVLASYVFAIFHLYINIKLCKPKWSKKMKVTLVTIPIVTVFTFTMIAYDTWGQYDELAFDLVYSNLFVIGASLTLAFAVIGASIFRDTVLKETWLLLASGIFLWVMADFAYAYLETIEAFTHNHPINTLWMISFMVIIYALFKHHKAL